MIAITCIVGKIQNKIIVLTKPNDISLACHVLPMIELTQTKVAILTIYPPPLGCGANGILDFVISKRNGLLAVNHTLKSR